MICSACGAANRDGARFCDSCGAALAAEPAREQRKVVTVLFCDVSGSTALGERLDPEALRAVMARYFDAARAAIERHGGTLEKFIGDAVMAVFGVPTVREDDALRAVRAAEELRDAVEIDVRIGVNTGEVVTGSADALVTGDAVNVAARLEQAASAGEVLLGEATYRLVRDAVDVELLPPVEAKGKSEPLAAYRLRAVTGDVAVARRGDTPFVGRDAERRLLEDAWRRAVSTRSCVLFTILGSAGVGKSRLAAEFLAGVDARVARGRCLSYGEGITYWPVLDVVRELGGDVAPFESDTPADDLALAARRLLEANAGDGLVVVFDDVHWGEPTFLDLVEHVADWSRDAPILLLCLARPDLLDLRPTWGGGKLNAANVLLEPLSNEETDVLIDELGEIEESLRERIRTAADGNPLFVEQMVAMLAETPGEVTVPSSIQALLAARLDQLPPAERAALERGAVEGQVFHRGAVAALDGDPANLLPLVRKELVRPSLATVPGDDAFRFRHLLIRDAAYEALPKAVRAELHERFAAWLEERAPDLAEADEILGYHLEQAARFRAELGRPDEALARRAADRLGGAGKRARRRQDLPAAVGLLSRAVALRPLGDETRAALGLELALALQSAGQLVAAVAAADEALEHGDANTRARARVTRAALRAVRGVDYDEGLREVRQTIEELDGLDDATKAHAYAVLSLFQSWQGNLDPAAGRQAIAYARASGETLVELDATSRLGFGLMMGTARWDEVEAFAREADERFGRGQLLGRWGAEAKLASGRYAEGRALFTEAIAEFRERGASVTAWWTTAIRAWYDLAAGGLETAVADLGSSWLGLGELGEHGLRSTVGGLYAGALVDAGRVEDALIVLSETEEITTPGDFVTDAYAKAARARIALAEGKPERAVQLAAEACDLVDASDYLYIRPFFWFGRGEALLAAGRRDEARAAFEECIRLAELKGTVIWASTARELLSTL